MEEESKIVQDAGIKGSREFGIWIKTNKKLGIPSHPNDIYKDKGWTSWGDFFGTENIASVNKVFLSYEEASRIVKGIGIKSCKEFFTWIKEHKDLGIPSFPYSSYKDRGWTSWSDFLGTGNLYKKDFISYEEASKIVIEAGIKTGKEFSIWFKEHKDLGIPSAPDRTYKDEWTSWGDFLGTDNIYKTYEEAVKIVKEAGIKSNVEFRNWIKEHKDLNIPSTPERHYKNEWISWGDFLGTATIAPRNMKFISYEEACKIVREAGIKSCKEFNTWIKEHKDLGIPSAPDIKYKEWTSFGDFFGTGISIRKRDFVSYEDACKIIRELGFESIKEFNTWIKNHKDSNIPTRPDMSYKDIGWTSWSDFLGTEIIAKFNKTFVSYDEACKIVREAGIKSIKEFRNWYNSHKKIKIPRNPNRIYEEWTSWGDFLGTGIIATCTLTFVSYDEACKIVREAGIKTEKEFHTWIKDHKDLCIPSSPYKVYKDEWTSWGDFFGTGIIASIKIYKDKLYHRSSICSKLLDKKDLLLMDKGTIRLLYIYLKCFDKEITNLLLNSIDKTAEERVDEISNTLDSIKEKLESSDIDDDFDMDTDVDIDTFEDTDDLDITEDDVDTDITDEKLIAIDSIIDEFDFESLDDSRKKYLNEMFDCYIKKIGFNKILVKY